MKRNPIPRRLAALPLALATLVGASPFLATPAARSVPVFSQAVVESRSYADIGAPGNCAVVRSTEPPSTREVAVDGPDTTAQHRAQGTLTNNADPSDSIVVSTAMSGRARVTTEAGNPAVLELEGTGQVAADASKPISACVGFGFSAVSLSYTFTVSRPGFLTVTIRATQHTYLEMWLYEEQSSSTDFSVNGRGTRPNGTYTVYLPAGVYVGRFQTEASIRTAGSIPATPVSASVRARFDTAGSRTDDPAGKAAKYVRLPSTRSCSTGTVDAAVTSKGKRAARIQRVKYVVNGKVARVLKRPAKGKVTRLPVPLTSTAEVRAVVTEVKRRNGRPGKVVQVAAGYAACG